VTAAGEDDFADFQAAPSSPPSAAPLAAAPVASAAAAVSKPNLMDLLASTAPATSKPIQSAQPQPFGAFNNALVPSSSQVRPSSTPATVPAFAAMPAISPMSARSAVTSPVTAGSPSVVTTSTKLGGGGGGGGFDDLWTMSLGSATASKPGGGAAGAKSIRDLEKEKAQAGIWGAQNQMRPPAAAAAGGGFGSFVKSAVPSGGGGGAPTGADDLLL
jgi:epsin